MQTICIYKAQFVANCIHLGNPSNSVTQSNISCCFTIVAVQTKNLNYKYLNSWPSQFKDSSLNYCHFSKEDQIHKQFIQHKEQRGVKNNLRTALTDSWMQTVALHLCSTLFMTRPLTQATKFHEKSSSSNRSENSVAERKSMLWLMWFRVRGFFA